jgi:hypothetical protein
MSAVIVVSGLPRSGTSLLMQMLHGGGVEVLTDNVRAADVDNPRGYYELERVKHIKQDASWLPEARGKAFKMVSLLLYDLPPGESYRVVFMERDLDEMLLSQEQMLRRLGKVPGPRGEMRRAYEKHLARLHEWLARQPNVAVLRVNYGDLVERPREQAERVAHFLGGAVDVAEMAQAVDASLYRNRKPSGTGDDARNGGAGG